MPALHASEIDQSYVSNSGSDGAIDSPWNIGVSVLVCHTNTCVCVCVCVCARITTVMRKSGQMNI